MRPAPKPFKLKMFNFRHGARSIISPELAAGRYGRRILS